MLGDTEDVHGPGLDVVLAGTGRGNKLAPPASDAAGSARCQSFRQPARIAWAPGELRSRRRTGKGSKGGRLAVSFALLCTGMSRRKSARNYFTAERFAKVCETTKWNVRAALDLIFIHAEKEVRGRQPRASLNPFTVLAAVAAYERFFDHLYAAATDRPRPSTASRPRQAGQHKDEWEPGSAEKEIGRAPIPELADTALAGRGSVPQARRQWIAQSIGELLREAGIARDLTSYWKLWVSESWFGASPTDWTLRTYSDNPEAFSRSLHAARHARDGAAHFILPKTAARAREWFDPIPITEGGLFAKKLLEMGKTTWDYSWDSDAKSDTVQSGFARGITAFFVQLIDSSIVAVADSHGWSPRTYRLPSGWFAAEVPSSDSRYAGAQFWGGQALHRVRSERRAGGRHIGAR